MYSLETVHRVRSLAYAVKPSLLLCNGLIDFPPLPLPLPSSFEHVSTLLQTPIN